MRFGPTTQLCRLLTQIERMILLILALGTLHDGTETEISASRARKKRMYSK